MLIKRIFCFIVFLSVCNTSAWAQLVVNTTVNNALICGEDYVDVTVNITSGTPNFTIIIPGATKTFMNNAPISYTFSVGHFYKPNLKPKSHLVTVRDGKGNIYEKDLKELVSIKPMPKVNLTLKDAAICPSGNPAMIKIVNSEAGVTYQLQDASTNTNVGTAVNGNDGEIGLPASPAATTTYNIIATHQGSGCPIKLNNTATITYMNRPKKTLLVKGAEVCKGSTAAIIVEKSQVGVTYQLRKADDNSIVTSGTAIGNGNTIYLNAGQIMETTKYKVEASILGSNGCVETLDTQPTITVSEIATFTTSKTKVTCFNGNDGSITITINSGVPPYTYKLTQATAPFQTYSSGETTESTYTFTGLKAGTYNATVINKNGCSGK